jgi:hypothetical protein
MFNVLRTIPCLHLTSLHGMRLTTNLRPVDEPSVWLQPTPLVAAPPQPTLGSPGWLRLIASSHDEAVKDIQDTHEALFSCGNKTIQPIEPI